MQCPRDFESVIDLDNDEYKSAVKTQDELKLLEILQT